MLPQAFSPAHIHAREVAQTGSPRAPTHHEVGSFTGAAGDVVARADTLVLGTTREGYGTSASHRGGRAGFVRVLDERTLAWPDYEGNAMFLSLGNLLRDPRAGVTFVDFERRALLQLTGTAEILWAGSPSDGWGDRTVVFHLDAGRLTDDALPFDFTAADPSPFNPR